MNPPTSDAGYYGNIVGAQEYYAPTLSGNPQQLETLMEVPTPDTDNGKTFENNGNNSGGGYGSSGSYGSDVQKQINHFKQSQRGGEDRPVSRISTHV